MTAVIDIPDNFVEQKLKSAIFISSSSKYAFLKQLLRNYTPFKNSLGAVVKNNLLQYWTFQEGARDDIMHSKAFADHASCGYAKLFEKTKLKF